MTRKWLRHHFSLFFYSAQPNGKAHLFLVNNLKLIYEVGRRWVKPRAPQPHTPGRLDLKSLSFLIRLGVRAPEVLSAPPQSQLLPALSPRLPYLFRAHPFPPPPPSDGSTQTTYNRVRPTVTHQHTLMIHPPLESRNKMRVFLPSSKGRCCWFSGWTFRFPTTVLTRGSTPARPTVSLAPFGTDDRADSRTALKTYSRQQSGPDKLPPGVSVLPPTPGLQPHGPCTPT